MTYYELLSLFLVLVIGHVVADYPLQGEFLATAKNETDPIPNVPWWQAMWAHTTIHGGMVWLITGSLFLGLMETIAHFIIDRGKCLGWYSYNTDQALHILFKVCWACAIWFRFV